MNKRTKPASKEGATTHPETTKHVPKGAPGDASSKASGKARDGRSGQDKDGNEQHPKAAER